MKHRTEYQKAKTFFIRWCVISLLISLAFAYLVWNEIIPVMEAKLTFHENGMDEVVLPVLVYFFIACVIEMLLWVAFWNRKRIGSMVDFGFRALMSIRALFSTSNTVSHV